MKATVTKQAAVCTARALVTAAASLPWTDQQTLPSPACLGPHSTATLDPFNWRACRLQKPPLEAASSAQQIQAKAERSGAASGRQRVMLAAAQPKGPQLRRWKQPKAPVEG